MKFSVVLQKEKIRALMKDTVDGFDTDEAVDFIYEKYKSKGDVEKHLCSLRFEEMEQLIDELSELKEKAQTQRTIEMLI